MSEIISSEFAKFLWLEAQGLTVRAPFGSGAGATPKAIEHLGYVQIDTIHVIERCHHHILFTRIPSYRKSHLHCAQSADKSVFEYWAHALAYLPTRDLHFFIPEMRRMSKDPGRWFKSVTRQDMLKVLNRIKKDGPISIRDVDDDVLVEKAHDWASKKPSKWAMQLGFYTGQLVISERQGMLKKYELMDRHFGWDSKPKAATKSEVSRYLLDRALRSQALVSLESICYLNNKAKPPVAELLSQRARQKSLVPVRLQGDDKTQYWTTPETLEKRKNEPSGLVHLLSPFDPLVIQRKRFQKFFGYEHKFEAYLPKEKRTFGYFALPVLIGDQVVALIDLKTDRQKNKLLIQQWSWLKGMRSAHNRRLIEEELIRFEKFQLLG
jgi:uncharacterized protein YcaQ